ncbi:MAG TPA: caspase family protein [Gaiellaceae bacterium]
MKRALLIGIDQYDNFNNLAGCVNDADALEPLISRNEDDSLNFECQKRTSATGGVTRDALLGDLEALFGGGADIAVLYFAGHGDGVPNDVVLMTVDGTNNTPGIPFSEVMTKVVNSQVGEVIVLLDCCFSGAAGGIPQLGTAASALRPGVSILMASRGDQTAAETGEGRGLFSTYLSGALEGGAADVRGKVTLAGLYSYLDESFGAWDQRPVFKTNVDRLHEIRGCIPTLPPSELRQINALFPAVDHVFSLDPSYEDTVEDHDPEHAKVFKVLQRYRYSKLVDPIDEEYMYYAAVNSTACQLTPLGRHYWHMASEGRL